MSKGMKNKKNKVPKINDEEYAAYIALLKEEGKTPTGLGAEREILSFADPKSKTQ